MTTKREESEEALRRNLQRIKTEGLDAATDAALCLLRDEKAPAQAKSATINAIYRAAGLFGRPGEGDKELELHEMSPEQLARETDRIIRQLSGRTATDDITENDERPSAFD